MSGTENKKRRNELIYGENYSESTKEKGKKITCKTKDMHNKGGNNWNQKAEARQKGIHRINKRQRRSYKMEQEINSKNIKSLARNNILRKSIKIMRR